MADFAHLHVHSHYSLLDGLSTVPNLLKHAGKLGMDTLALTDHGVLYGAVEFSKKAKELGIKPIIGCELYVAPRKHTDKIGGIDKSPYHLIVLCKNKIGYQNLLKLVSIAHLDGYYYKPRVDHELLQKYSEGLLCLTACLQSEVSKPAGNDDPEAAEKALLIYRDIFGPENLYVELQYHPELPAQTLSNNHLIQIAKKHNFPVIATNDVHYLESTDAEAQDALLCIQTGKLVSDTDRMIMKENGQWIDISMTPTDLMRAHFPDTPEAISNTLLAAKMCNFEMEMDRFIFPAFPVPPKKTPAEHLKDLCIEGLYTKILKLDAAKIVQGVIPEGITETYKTRMEYELGIIAKTGFDSYMLMVADYTNEAKRRGIFTNTRGSAAGSLVAYLTGITDFDPLPYNLIFERFLNPERVNWPDVDLDIADVRRGELIEYVTNKYGADKVAQIITFGTIAAKNSIRDVGRVMGIPYAEVDAISKLIPLGSSLDEAMENVPLLQSRYDTEPQVQQLIDLAKKIEGVARHASVHAAGVVISDAPLTDYVPIMRVKEEAGLVTQYAMNDLEKVGLVKMDFLGLANLTIIEQALKVIKATRGVAIIPAELPLDDKKTYQLLARGESSGVFQLESDGMKRYLKELKPTEIGDIIAMVALYRPGPMELIPDYIAGKHGHKTVTYLHPKLEPILGDTYGIAVYQEQIIQIARELCGFSYGEADVLRKAIGKKIKELLLEQRVKWVEKGVESGITKQLAEKLFDFVEPFARYGFNKAHATSYGMIAYQTAYLKTHFPSQFMAAWLTSEQSRDMDKVAFALNECERMGIPVLPPDVNESYADFGVVPTEDLLHEPIRFGLGAVKNVGHAVAELIVDERKTNGPYQSLSQFIERLDQKIINRKTMEALIQAGAFDLFADRNQLLLGIEQILKYSHAVHHDSKDQMGLFDDTATKDLSPLILPKADPTTKQQRLQWEKELLGIYLSEHPMGDFRKYLGTVTTPIKDLTEEMVGKTVRVLGIVTSAKQIITKSKQPMAFVRIDDSSGTTEVIVFPSLLTLDPSAWTDDRIIVVDGKVNDKDGSVKVIADAVWDVTEAGNLESVKLPPLKAREDPRAQYRKSTSSPSAIVKPQGPLPELVLHLTIPEGADKEVLQELKDILASSLGTSSVVLHIPHGETTKEIRTASKIDPNPPLLHKLKRLIGNENLTLKA